MTTGGELPRARSTWTTQHNLEITNRDLSKGGQALVIELETQLLVLPQGAFQSGCSLIAIKNRKLLVITRKFSNTALYCSREQWPESTLSTMRDPPSAFSKARRFLKS